MPLTQYVLNIILTGVNANLHPGQGIH